MASGISDRKVAKFRRGRTKSLYCPSACGCVCYPFIKSCTRRDRWKKTTCANRIHLPWLSIRFRVDPAPRRLGDACTDSNGMSSGIRACKLRCLFCSRGGDISHTRTASWCLEVDALGRGDFIMGSFVLLVEPECESVIGEVADEETHSSLDLWQPRKGGED